MAVQEVVSHPLFEFRRGDLVEIDVPVEAAGGGPADLAGATVSFAYSKTQDGLVVNASKGSATPTVVTTTYKGAPHPTIRVMLNKAETSGLVPLTKYYWASRVVGPGIDTTVAGGSFRAKYERG